MSAVPSMDSPAFEHLRPAVDSDVVIRWYDDEAVAWSSRASRPASLSAIAAMVFQMLDGSASVGEIIDDIHDVVGVPRPIAAQRLFQILKQFDEAALLAIPDASWPAGGQFDPFPGPLNH